LQQMIHLDIRSSHTKQNCSAREIDCRRTRSLPVVLLLSSIVIAFAFVQPISASSSQLVWVASFKGGNWASYFNAGFQTSCNATISTSNKVHYADPYSGYYSHTGPVCDQPVRAYPHEQVTPTLTDYAIMVWVYVPSVTLTDWVSFVTMHMSDETFITVDSTQQVLHLWNNALPLNARVIPQQNPIQWSFNTWFNIRVEAHLKPGTVNSQVTVYQNNMKIINFVGNTGNGSLWYMHFGLYTGPKQTTFSVYNDNIQLWQLVTSAATIANFRTTASATTTRAVITSTTQTDFTSSTSSSVSSALSTMTSVSMTSSTVVLSVSTSSTTVSSTTIVSLATATTTTEAAMNNTSITVSSTSQSSASSTTKMSNSTAATPP